MSDLLRSLRKQPLALPIMGSETEVYDDPGTDWDGEPVRVELTNGEQLQGFLPNTRITPEPIVWALGELGEGLASLLDSPALTWSSPLQTRTNAPDFSGVGQYLVGPIVAPGQYTGQNAEILLAINNAGCHRSRDGWEWNSQGTVGFASDVDTFAAGTIYNGANRDMLVVAFSYETGDYEFRKSADAGATWSAAGNAPAAVNTGAKLGFFGGFEHDLDDEQFTTPRIFLVAEGQVFYTDEYSPTTWTSINVSGFWTTGDPTVIRATTAECLVGIDAAPYVARTADGASWAAANSGLTGTAGVLDLVWSESHAAWIMLRDDGSIWTAPAGVGSWSLRGTPTNSRTGTALSGGTALAVHGRTIIVAIFNWLYASRDFTNWARLSPQAHAGTGATEAWQFLLPFNGAIWAGHIAAQLDGSGSTFEHSMSGVLAPELARVTPW